MAEQVLPPNKVRKPYKRPDPVDSNEQARRQRAAAKRTLEAQQRKDIDPTLFNAELTSPAHAGRHPDEPVKPRAQSARKTDARHRAGITGPKDIHTVGIDPGKQGGPTDEVVVDPAGAGPMAGGEPVKSHAEIAAEAASKARGKAKGKRKGSARRKAADAK